MSTTERNRRVRDLFDVALDLDADARAAFLRDACADEPEVRREVESLLAALDGARADRLFPRLTPYRGVGAEVKFDPKLYLRYREYRAALGLLVAWGVLALKVVLAV